MGYIQTYSFSLALCLLLIAFTVSLHIFFCLKFNDYSCNKYQSGLFFFRHNWICSLQSNSEFRAYQEPSSIPYEQTVGNLFNWQSFQFSKHRIHKTENSSDGLVNLPRGSFLF